MHRPNTLFAALAGLAASGALAAAPGVERLAWLAGCWQGQFGEPGTIESWLVPAGGTMLGVSRTVTKGETAEFEFMQLRELPDGVLAFIAQPAGRPPTSFRAVRLGVADAVFENAENDFPQRITYSRIGDTRLVATLESSSDGAARKVELEFSRVSCDAQRVQD